MAKNRHSSSRPVLAAAAILLAIPAILAAACAEEGTLEVRLVSLSAGSAQTLDPWDGVRWVRMTVEGEGEVLGAWEKRTNGKPQGPLEIPPFPPGLMRTLTVEGLLEGDADSPPRPFSRGRAVFDIAAGEHLELTVYISRIDTFAGLPVGMAHARQGHTATLLSDGRVLIVGGIGDEGEVLGSAEIYNPLSGSFTEVPGGLECPRYKHTATLVADGRVIIIGGRGPSCRQEVIQEIEAFDPLTESFSTLVWKMRPPRYAHTATVLDPGGVRVLVAGGFSATDEPWGTAHTFEAGPDTFGEDFIDLLFARAQHTATSLLPSFARVVLAGGVGKDEKGEWKAVGGESIRLDSLSSDYKSDALARNRIGHTVTALNDGRLVLVAFGLEVIPSQDMYGPKIYETAQTYHPGTGQVEDDIQDMSDYGLDPSADCPGTRPSNGRYDHRATRLDDDTVLITGGVWCDGIKARSGARFDPDANAFLDPTSISMIKGRARHTATLLRDGTVLIVGGADDEKTHASAELYNPPRPGDVSSPLDDG